MQVRLIEDYSIEQATYGGHTNPDGILNTEDTYQVESLECHDWHTVITLFDQKGHFNSVCFTLVSATEFA